MLHKIIREAENHKNMIRRLKEVSPYFPKYTVYIQEGSSGDFPKDTCWLTTIVRVHREGRWWTLHHAKCVVYPNFSPAEDIMMLREQVLQQLFDDCWKATHLWTFSGHEEPDPLQVDEQTRLTGNFNQYPYANQSRDNQQAGTVQY